MKYVRFFGLVKQFFTLKTFVNVISQSLLGWFFVSFAYASTLTHENPSLAKLPIKVFAAQNFYGQLAKQIGGPYVDVFNVSNDQQDPHHFEISIDERRILEQADLVLQNGLGYETWLVPVAQTHVKPHHLQKHFHSHSHSKQTTAAQSPVPTVVSLKQRRIIAADLLDKPNNGNPHIWYDPSTMPLMAQALTEALSQLAPTHRKYFRLNLQIFNERYERLKRQIADIKRLYTGTLITATEPIFNDMASALGLVMQHQRFQAAIMNHTEPSARDAALLENDLRHKRVKILIENLQTHTPFSKRFVEIARESGVKVVKVRENMPVNQKDYISWMSAQLNELQRALSLSNK